MNELKIDFYCLTMSIEQSEYIFCSSETKKSNVPYRQA